MTHHRKKKKRNKTIMNTDIINLRCITVDEFIDLRRSVEWGIPEKDAIVIGLENTLFSVCIERDGQLIGYGRVIGDGGFTVYIQDVIVKPAFQKQCIGSKIMSIIMNYIKENYGKGTYIGLMASKGKEKFYKRFAFIERPNEHFGAGMIQFL
jgi:predicted GNAT family N-acyltransferase